MAIPLRKRLLVTAVLVSSLPATGALAAGAPTVPQALAIKPVQKDVDYDQPAAEEVGKCTIKPEKAAGKTGWVLRNAKGQIIRNFADTDGDNRVDQWSYFKDGIEVYRDIDSNHNGKADQFRWLNTAGTRRGSDTNEDRVIDTWDAISAEEVSAELVAAIRDHDRARFQRLLPSEKELETLGLGPARLEEMRKRIAAAPAAFDEYVRNQKVITPQSTWVYFGGGRPQAVPAGTDESTADITLYDNVAAMVETDGKPGQVPVGTLVKVESIWKMLGAPDSADAGLSKVGGPAVAQSSDGASERASALMDEMNKIDKVASPSREQIKRKCDILEELAGEAKPGKERADWYRPLADVLGAAAQDGTYPEAVERLKELKEKLAAEDDNDLAAYVEFRWMTASYNQELARPDVDYKKVQDQRLENLENYVERHPTSVDSAEAMWQLAMGQEFAGDDQNAIKWYNRVVKNFGKTATAVKSAGAVRRLESVGKTISLKGKSLGGRSVDLSAAKGKVVLIHYWASDIPACLVDLPAIEKMVNKYEPNLLVVGVSLDNSRQALETYLRANPLPWPNIWEEGGMENRLATEMGIIVEPTMILIDAKGKVVDRSTHAISLDNELKAMLKPNPNMATRPGKPN